MKVSKRLISVDLIRVLAMLMVVALHTILNFTVRPDFFATKTWFILEPLVAFSKIGVLLFFMISGYLVINKNRSIKDNLKITKDRIFFPLCFFSLINLGYELYKFSLLGKNFSLFWKSQLLDMANFPNSPLWFLVVLLFLYLLNPVWQIIFSKEKSSNLALYLTKLSLIFSISVTIIKFSNPNHDTFFNSATLWLGYLFFYFYGGLVKNGWIVFNKKKINILMIVAGLLTTIIGDYYTIFFKVHSLPFILSGYFFEYLSIPIILLAVGTFNLFISSDFAWLTKNSFGQKIADIIMFFSRLSFGVYLIHPFITSILTDVFNFDFDKLVMNIYLYNFLNYFLVLGISLMITYLIIKTSRLKFIVGGR